MALLTIYPFNHLHPSFLNRTRIETAEVLHTSNELAAPLSLHSTSKSRCQLKTLLRLTPALVTGSLPFTRSRQLGHLALMLCLHPRALHLRKPKVTPS